MTLIFEIYKSIVYFTSQSWVNSISHLSEKENNSIWNAENK